MSQHSAAATDATGEAALRTPRITFYRLIPGARMPQRADRSAGGTLPTRAFRYCEPVVTASAFGYYIFPPMNFSVIWDGHEISWIFDGAPDWMPLTNYQFPDFAEHFNERAPAEIRGYSPPFVSSMQEPGLMQMWSGLVARTAPGWSLLVRPVANLPRGNGCEPYEGVIETDRWFGPLVANMRLTKTNVPIEFNKDFPLLQVQPLPREALDDTALNNYEIVPELENFAPEDWDDYYETVVRPSAMTNRPKGEYAAAARRRRKGEE